MYYVIRDSGVYSAPKLSLLNQRYKMKMSEDEFKIVGKDFVCKLTNQDFDFVQDKQKMENLLFSGFFRKDNSVKLLLMMNLIFSFVQFFIH